MKQFTNEQKLYVFNSLEPRAESIMDMVRQNPDKRWDNEIKELELIKSIFVYMIDETEMVTGVITVPKSQMEDVTQMVKENNL